MTDLGACYYPEHWPPERWAIDARQMREAGFTTVRIGEFAWALLEPAPGRFEWAWLEEAVQTLADAGLAVVLGTPTAAPPPWLTHRHPEVLPVGPDGRVRQPGSRRHYCVNSPRYLELCGGIVRAMADRLGQHPAVVGWQVDNELGCHDTARCYCQSCVQRFRFWLQARHGTLEALNEAWGTAFWSQRYTDWEEILPPAGLVYEANPGHWLDWCRAASNANLAFLVAQTVWLRERSPGRWITHNLMGNFDDLDHAALAAPLDAVGWDNYAPPGWTPAQQAMAHDRMRGLLGRPFWVLEQQCSAINWGETNPAPPPGQARLWTYQAVAHGARGVLYFRWRAGQVGAEQLHGGILPHDGEPGRTYRELAATARELAALPAPGPTPSRVALLYGEESRWALRQQPHHREVGPDDYDLPYYEALGRRGLDVDVLPPTADFSSYELVVAGSPYVLDDGLQARLEAFVAGGGTLVLGPRAGFKDGHNRVRPAGMRALTGARVAELDAADPERPWGLAFAAGPHVPVETLFERLEPAPDVEVLARYPDGSAGVTRRGKVYYVGAVGREVAEEVVRLATSGLQTLALPESVEVARRGGLSFVLNHGRAPVELPWPGPGHELLSGTPVAGRLALPPLGVAVVQQASR